MGVQEMDAMEMRNIDGGLPFLIAIGIANVVFIVLAAMAVSEGKPYRYPINLRLIK